MRSKTYVSTQKDDACIIVTASKTTLPLLMAQLSASGATAIPIPLRGRFHSKKNEEALATMLDLCASHSNLQYPPNQNLAVPVSTDINSNDGRSLHEIASRSILVGQSNWSLAIASATSQVLQPKGVHILAIGDLNSLHQSTEKEIVVRATYLRDFELSECPKPSSTASRWSHVEERHLVAPYTRDISGNDIAIIGMACRFPGAGSIEEFWQLLCEGISMHQEIPIQRFSMNNPRMTTGGEVKFWGNFLTDADAFDHIFFGISSREAASMDPQQRILLQLAYQALESSWYFDEVPKPHNVGCFLGVGSVEYEGNVASHSPTAFSALGTLRAFVSGKISHHFGWTGPSITYDTACSSSAVAIHSACQALQLGECSSALAGGVNMMTSTAMYQNLGKAGFLSPTGPCKAFDGKADGYCRGEGAGLVVLKRLSTAIADGDPIAAIIAGSAVSQSENCTPITVPNSASQIDLYRKVTSIAGVDPMNVSFVEAHGTGTIIGDPVECESIRQVFGGCKRSDTLYFGSVKANIGHTEAASGVAALIKAVLIMNKETVPKQANFRKLNPQISPLRPDKMDIPAETQQWKGSAVCLNNYGAAGSISALVVCRYPARPSSREIGEDTEQRRPPKNPIHLSAHSTNSLRAKCMALRQYLVTKTTTCSGETDIESVAFNLAHAADHSLPTFTTITTTSLSELCSDLSTLGSGCSEFQTRNHVAERAVVLCFGGQTKDFIGMSKDVYHRVSILRLHLDHCNSVCQSLGVRPLLPAIFRKTPIDDLELLHCLLFSLQYACARSWIECGLRVDALIGHSFGQLTALCVSGSISLEEAMRLIAGRATLMQKLWGSERGAMIAIESDFENVSHILSLASESEKSTRAEIACFNSPTSHVVAGTQRSIKAVEDIIALRQKSSPSLKSKRLGVTHAFHSHLADSIVPGLTELAHTVRFLKPKIPVETCTRKQSLDPVEAKDIARYSRDPVYFSQAVRRIETRLGPCAWLEAGSDSPITIMASHALEPSVRAKHAFQPVSLASADARDLLAEATVDLWKLGLKVQFWPYHRVQRHCFSQLNLPPYQFEMPRHWLENAVSPVPRTQALERGLGLASPILSLISFVRPQNEGRSIAEFQIDPESQQFRSYLEGHKVLGNSLCPASLYAHLATKAASAVSENGAISSENFRLEDLQFQTPLGLNNENVISLFLRVTDDCPDRFTFEFCSRQYEDTFQQLIHATGALYIEQTASARLEIEFARYERIASSRRLQLLAHNGSESSIAGGFIYKVFSSVVDYAEYFRGVERIASSGWEVAGRIMIPEPPTDLLDGGIWEPLLIDNFLQLAGLHINCLQGREQSKVHVCTRIGKLQPSRELRGWNCGPWEVFSRLEALEGGEVSSNIFVIDPRTEALVFTILGARFTEVSITSLARTLSRTDSCERHPTASPGKPHATPAGSDSSAGLYRRLDFKTLEHPLPKNGGDDAFFEAVRQMLNRVTDVPIQDMKHHSRLEAIGVDSLMTIEVMEEIEKVFRVSIPMSEFQELTDLESLCLRIGVTKPPNSQSLEPLERTTPHYEASPNKNSDPDGIQESRQDEIDQVIRTTSTTSSIELPIEQILAALHEVQGDFDSFANEANFVGFLQRVHPRQFELTVAYVAEAFDKLGCSLLRLREGEVLPDLPCLPKHKKLVAQLQEILAKAGLIRFQSTANVRTAEPISDIPAHVLYRTMLDDFPQHFSEHRLLGYMGSLLAECLSGKMEAVHLMFGHQENRDLLEDMYSNAPAFATGSKVLISFLSKLLATKSTSKPVQILEVGAGTGATSIRVVELLRAQNIPYNYTFTDISSSLVANARKRFAGDASMNFAVLDIENAPPEYLLCSQDIIVSTNAIHATKSLAHSSANMRNMLRANGILCLVEFTRRLYWFDIVFGLLEGWWLFEDSRTHAIAHESFWKQCLLEAGFALVDWSTGGIKESNEIRLIVALSRNVATEGHALEGQPETKMETLLFKQIGRIPLYADIYYPRNMLARKSRLAVGRWLSLRGGCISSCQHRTTIHLLNAYSTNDTRRRQYHALAQRHPAYADPTPARPRPVAH